MGFMESLKKMFGMTGAEEQKTPAPSQPTTQPTAQPQSEAKEPTNQTPNVQ
jgi:FtsZ-interacting cell division protein YlmF